MSDPIFTEKIYNFGNVGQTDTVVAIFEVDDAEKIEYIDPSCGCTDGYVDGNQVVAELSIADAGKYGPGKTGVSKTVTVFHNDGRQEFIANEHKLRIKNPEKGKTVLRLFGNVVI